MDKRHVVSKLRQHRDELTAAGIVHLRVFGLRPEEKRTIRPIESRRACPELVERGRLRVNLVQINFFRCARFVAHSLKTNQLSGLIAISPEGTTENSPGRTRISCVAWWNQGASCGFP